MKSSISNQSKCLMLAVLVLMTQPVFAQLEEERIQRLEDQSKALAREVERLRSEMKTAERNGQGSEAVIHVGGYGSAGYTDEDDGDEAFNMVNFSPIFHVQHGDRILWESELEVEVEEDGETEVKLEYSTIDVFLNDYVVLVAGKFLSPLGYFRQNLHPAWINKLASAPPGFGHDGAAPSADVGLQLRGGVPITEQSRFTYSLYIANGPNLEADDGELHSIETEGFGADKDDEKVLGGRVSILPLPRLEVGVSGAFGDIAVVSHNGVDITNDPARDYQVLGVDFAYQVAGVDLRAEYIKQEIDDAANSVAPIGEEWETWYAQVAYRLPNTKWELVARYTDFSSPHLDDEQEQTMLGVNYVLLPSAIIKLGYEMNDGLANAATDHDRWIAQIAYGF